MIDRLDRRPVQVYLATVIGEMTLSNDVEFGIDYLKRDPNQSGLAGGVFNRRTDAVTNNAIADLSSMITTTPVWSPQRSQSLRSTSTRLSTP